MIPLYPDLLKYVVEFRVESRKMLALHNGEEYHILPEHETVPAGKGFAIVKDAKGNYIGKNMNEPDAKVPKKVSIKEEPKINNTKID